MKNKNIYAAALVLTSIAFGITSCSDEFLE